MTTPSSTAYDQSLIQQYLSTLEYDSDSDSEDETTTDAPAIDHANLSAVEQHLNAMTHQGTLASVQADLGIDPATLPQLAADWTWEFIDDSNVDDTKWEYMDYCDWIRDPTEDEMHQWGVDCIAVRSDVLPWCRINGGSDEGYESE